MHILNKKGKNMKCNGVVHKIEEGETLYMIAKLYGVKLRDLMEMNPYLDVYNLQIGDEICVPVNLVAPKCEKYVSKVGDTFKKLLDFSGGSIQEMFDKNPHLYKYELPEKTVIEGVKCTNKQ